MFPLVCPLCGGNMRNIAFVTEGVQISKILAHIPAGVRHGNGASGGSRARASRSTRLPPPPACRPGSASPRSRSAPMRCRSMAPTTPVLRRPEVGAAVRQPGARGFESDRRAFVLAQRLALQAVAHPGRSRTLVQLLVDGLHPCRFHSRSQPSRHRPTQPTSRGIARQPATFGRCCRRAVHLRGAASAVSQVRWRDADHRLHHRSGGDPGDSRSPGRADASAASAAGAGAAAVGDAGPWIGRSQSASATHAGQ